MLLNIKHQDITLRLHLKRNEN